MMKTAHRKLGTVALRSGLGAFALTLVAAGGMHLHAQAIAGHNSRAPVNFDAGRIELQDRQNRVVLSGSVTVTQAGLTVKSDRMLVNYSDASGVDINRITATGGVTVTRGNEAASGNVAVYDFSRRIITMAGDVRLRRGGDTLSGGRLVIDLASGVSSVDGQASGSTGVAGTSETRGGRVTGSFTVPQD